MGEKKVVNQVVEEQQMEKAHHKLYSIKLLSGANSEQETAVTGISTRLSQESQYLRNRRERRGISTHSCKR